MAVKLTIELDPELRRRAKAAAALQGRSLADVVRAALESFVEQSTSPQPPRLAETDPIFQLAGRYSGSAANVSENADDIIETDIDPVRGLSVDRGRAD